MGLSAYREGDYIKLRDDVIIKRIIIEEGKIVNKQGEEI